MFPLLADRQEEVDYIRTVGSLSPAKAEKAAAVWLPRRLSHLHVVRVTVARYAAETFADLPPRAARYWGTVCEATAMLHEAMRVGRSFEDVRAVTDEATARAISAMTPDGREPVDWRRQMLANRIGLSPLHVQLVALADLEVSWRDDPAGAWAVLDVLTKAGKSPSTAAAVAKVVAAVRGEYDRPRKSADRR